MGLRAYSRLKLYRTTGPRFRQEVPLQKGLPRDPQGPEGRQHRDLRLQTRQNLSWRSLRGRRMRRLDPGHRLIFPRRTQQCNQEGSSGQDEAQHTKEETATTPRHYIGGGGQPSRRSCRHPPLTNFKLLLATRNNREHSARPLPKIMAARRHPMAGRHNKLRPLRQVAQTRRGSSSAKHDWHILPLHSTNGTSTRQAARRTSLQTRVYTVSTGNDPWSREIPVAPDFSLPQPRRWKKRHTCEPPEKVHLTHLVHCRPGAEA